MTENTIANAKMSQRNYWRSQRDQYLVDPAYRDEASGKLQHPVPESQAKCWVIIREVQDDNDPHELPAPVLIGEFGSRAVAELVCDLIIATGQSTEE